MSKTPDLIAAYWTLAGDVLPFEGDRPSPNSLKHRAEAAARAGYSGMGLGHTDFVACVKDLGFAEIKSILSANGIRHLELEALLDWFTEGEPRRRSDEVRKDFLHAAEMLDVRQIKIAGSFDVAAPVDDRMIEAYDGLCKEAKEVGTRVCIETMPFTNIRDIRTGLALVTKTSHKNGGLFLDIWHLVRGGVSLDDIALIPSQYLVGAELNDGGNDVTGDFLNDCIHLRRTCGEGNFPVWDFVDRLHRAGFDGPIGVEILSNEQRKMDLARAASHSYQGVASALQ